MEAKTEIRYYFTYFTSNNLKYTAMNPVCYSHEVDGGFLYILVRQNFRLCLTLQSPPSPSTPSGLTRINNVRAKDLYGTFLNIHIFEILKALHRNNFILN
jgi:hypothetical protein